MRKRKVKLYRVTKRVVNRTEVSYFTGRASAWREQIRHYKRTGKWDEVEELECDFTNKGICKLLNDLK
jgi:hypothetical protein